MPDVAEIAGRLSEASQTGWLIEHDHVPLWFTLRGRCRDWTADSNEALRFARKCDAEDFMRDYGITNARATEHRWG